MELIVFQRRDASASEVQAALFVVVALVIPEL